MNRVLSRVVQFILYVFLIFAVVGVIYLCYRKGDPDSAGMWICAFLFFVLSWILMPALHEAGHLLCGKLCGMRLASIGFACWAVRRQGDKLKASFEPLRLIADDKAGECRMYPVATENTDKKFLFFAAGGVLLQAIYLAVCLPVVAIADRAYLWATIGATLPYCAYLFLVNALPLSSDCDGAVCYGILRKEPSQITALHIMTVQGYLAKGFTPGEIDEKLYFDLPQLPEDDINFGLLQYYRYAYFLDRGETGNAIKSITRMEDCLEYVPSSYLAPICVELLYTYSFLKENESLANQYHVRVERQKSNECGVDKVRAVLAYAIMSGNRKLREESLRQWEKAYDSEPLEGIKKYEEKLLRELYGV